MRQWQRGSPVVQFSTYGPISSHRAVHKEWICLVLPQLSCTVTLVMLVIRPRDALVMDRNSSFAGAAAPYAAERVRCR